MALTTKSVSAVAAILLLAVASVDAAPTDLTPPVNSTFSDGLPGNQVVCNSTNWYDIVWFFFANYIMHALSVRSLPGENFITSVVFKLACLMIPYTGLRRGLCLIARSSVLMRDDLQAAARANALCMVIRSDDWKPVNDQEVTGCTVKKIEEQDEIPDKDPLTTNLKGAETVALEQTITSVEESIGKQEDDSGPLVRIKRTFTFRTFSSRNSTGTNDDQKSKVPSPVISRIKDAFTGVITRSTDDASGLITFEPTDCYITTPATTILGKLYRTFVETYKFGCISIGREIRLDPAHVKVRGLCAMPPGYELVYVPPDIKVHSRGTPSPRPSILAAIYNRDFHSGAKALTSSTHLASTQNSPRILFSLCQTISGAWALYRAQGTQIEHFGIAAYGLTVLPYMIVSMINFGGSLLTKEYDMVYLAHSSVMDEMISRGGSVDGVIASTDPLAEDLVEAQDAPLNSLIAPGGSPGLLMPEGQTLKFRLNLDSPHTTTNTSASSPPLHQIDGVSSEPTQFISFRDTTTTDWSPPLKPTKLAKWKPAPMDTLTWGRAGWRDLRKRHRRRHNKHTGDEPPAGLTIVHIPRHGPLIRLPPPTYETYLHTLTLALLTLALATPYIVITLLTGWSTTHSESSQRSFIINWLVCGMVLGYGAGSVERLSGNVTVMKGLVVVFVVYGS